MAPKPRQDARERGKHEFTVEYAKSGRAACKCYEATAPMCKAVHGEDMAMHKGELRIKQTVKGAHSHPMSFCYHLCCVDDTILAKMLEVHQGPEELEGFSELSPEDQARIEAMFERRQNPEHRELLEAYAAYKAGDKQELEQCAAEYAQATAAANPRARTPKRRKAAEGGDDEGVAPATPAKPAPRQRAPGKRESKPPAQV